MFRRVIAGLILGPALLLGSFAWSGYLALQTVFDESRSETIARELLDNAEVRDQLAENLGTAIEGLLPEGAPVTGAQVDAAALAVLDDPRVTDLIIKSFGATHRAFLGQGDVPQELDLNPLAEIAREQVARVSPDTAAAIPADADWTVELPTERIPNSSPVKDFLETAVPYVAGISLVMVALAFLTTSDRPAVLRRAAFWAIGTTAVYLILGLGIPALLRAFAPAQAEVFAAFLTALLRTTLVPSIVIGAVGAGLLLASMVWPEGRREPKARRVEVAPQPEPVPVQAAPRHPASEPVAYDRRGAPARPAPVAPAEPTAPVASAAMPPTTHVPPTRPQASAPPHQPVTPPSTPAVRATPPSTPAVSPDAPPAGAPTTGLEPIVSGGNPSGSLLPPPVGPPPTPSAEPPPFRPTLPTRAAPGDQVSLPAWTGDLTPTPPPVADPRSRPPHWVDGHGWVLDPEDERPIPPNARYVEGVGYVVPGPPPRA